MGRNLSSHRRNSLFTASRTLMHGCKSTSRPSRHREKKTRIHGNGYGFNACATIIARKRRKTIDEMLAFNQNGQPYEPLTGYPGHEQIPPDRRTIFTATELSEANMPSINWLVPGLISSGLTLLAAGPKIGKSWLALQLSIAAATGGPARLCPCGAKTCALHCTG